MLSEDNLHNLYKFNYMQNPFDILTQENLERLEKHCKKAIHYEKRNLKEEHEIVLELLYRYQQLETNNKNLIEKLEDLINNKFRTFFEGNTEFPNNATKMKIVKYIKATDLEEILKLAKGEK